MTVFSTLPPFHNPKPLGRAWPRGVALWHMLVALGMATLSHPSTTHAYSTPAAFSALAPTGGGGGRYFTGSPAEGYGCAVCHETQDDAVEFPAYVSGLPLDGYGLAVAQQVVISWPEFADRWRQVKPDPTVALDPDVPPPAMGLLAEFVAENGKASGTLEVDTRGATEAELCERTRPNLDPKAAAQLYQVRPGLEAKQIKPDSTGMMRCTADQLGQRCILAMKSCGARELRVTWTTPKSWQGPIWFSGGFVATDKISGSYDADSVSEISIPLLPKNSQNSTYRQVLSGSCSMIYARQSTGPPPVWVFGPCLVLALGWVRVSLRTTRRRGDLRSTQKRDRR